MPSARATAGLSVRAAWAGDCANGAKSKYLQHMPQFDAYRNLIEEWRSQSPYVMDIQSDLVRGVRNRPTISLTHIRIEIILNSQATFDNGQDQQVQLGDLHVPLGVRQVATACWQPGNTLRQCLRTKAPKGFSGLRKQTQMMVIEC